MMFEATRAVMRVISTALASFLKQSQQRAMTLARHECFLYLLVMSMVAAVRGIRNGWIICSMLRTPSQLGQFWKEGWHWEQPYSYTLPVFCHGGCPISFWHSLLSAFHHLLPILWHTSTCIVVISYGYLHFTLRLFSLVYIVICSVCEFGDYILC